MSDVKRPDKGELHPNEGTHGRDIFRANAERKDDPSFIVKSLHDAGLLPEDYSLKKGGDGKFYLHGESGPPRSIDLKSLTKEIKENNPEQYEQAKYDMMKHALAEALSDQIKVDPKNIKEVQKVKDGYAYKYDPGDGKEPQDLTLSLREEDTRGKIAAFEKEMADYGFPIEEPKSDSIKQAVLKAVLKEAQIEGGAVQSYDSQSKKWYISKDGKIKEFSLDNQKIEDDAELEGVKKYLKVVEAELNGVKKYLKVVKAEFENDQHDHYKVKVADSPEWKIIAKKDVDTGIMNKIMGEKMINPDSYVTVIESNETAMEAKLKDINQRIDDLKEQQEKKENWAKTRRRALMAFNYLNQAAAQTSQNLDAVAQALQLDNGGSGIQPATMQNSHDYIKLLDDRSAKKVKLIHEEIKLLEKQKMGIEKQQGGIEKHVDLGKYKAEMEQMRAKLAAFERQQELQRDSNRNSERKNETLNASE